MSLNNRIQKTMSHFDLVRCGFHTRQRAKKVVSDSSGLVKFAIRLVNYVSNLPDG